MDKSIEIAPIQIIFCVESQASEVWVSGLNQQS